ncbi:cyclin-T isoform X1 [Linepithema humile]|uniref:cyclin-T isoform X1 n=1 Tax=Linepithema humile TaxID=83485 RepID=UPI00351DC06A
MASDERWYFTKEQLANSPSRRCGIDADKELSYRQQAANFIQDMGQRLVVSQLCINTAIVYMHRFYVFHSLTQFHRNAIAVAALFLAAKVEEQPRKLEHVIKMAYMCLHREQAPPDSRSEQFLEQAQDLVFNENVLLQTLGFDVAIDHPHTHVVRCCQLVKASKDLAQTSYFMASNSLHLTTMCLQYKPTVVACFCIHLACRWSNWEIPQSTEGRQWFWYVDRTVTSGLLQELTEEFLHIFDKCPSRLKKKIMSISANQSPSSHPPSLSNSPFDAEPRKVSPATMDGASTSGSAGSSSNLASSLSAAIAAYSNRSHHSQEKQDEKKSGAGMGSSTSRAAVDYREYREKKERERLEREKAAAAIGCHVADPSKSHHSHLHKTASSASVPSKHQVPVQKGSSLHHNHYHRPDMKVGQPVPQRHSTSGQSREPSRDPSRQRLSREHAAGIAHSSHSHGNLDSSSSESASHRTNGGATQDSTSSLHGNLQEKMSNNNYSGHRLNALDKHQTHDKRMYRVEDPRLKSAKYPDISKIENQRRKAETLEQRSEEVRKLIEKPLPPPKQADVPYLINAQAQKQQAHHSKYSQQDKSQSSSLAVDAKHLTATGQNALSQDKSPSALVSASSSQVPQKSQAPKTQMYNQHTAQNVSQILKDTIKNGNSQSCLSLNNMDDPKRSRTAAYEDSIERNSVDVQQILHTPPSKHRSLFSPETPTTREPHTQSARPKSKQKTPPVAAAKIKERVSPFASSPTSQDSLATKRPSSNDGPSSKKLRTSNIGEGESSIKVKQEIKMEDTSSLEAMKMLGRVPDLIQPIRDNPLLPPNGKNSSASSIINDLKPPELIKPFESDPHRFYAMSQHKPLSINMHMLSNGMDLNVQMKQETVEHRVKKELPEHYVKKESLGHKAPETSLPHVQPKVEYTSPMKSVQSISALLQEPLAPMPSLLQGLQQHNQVSLAQQVHQEQLQLQQSLQQSVHHPLMEHQLPVVTQCLSLPIVSDNPIQVASTVDISALSCVPLTQQASGNSVVESVSSVAMLTTVPPTEEKRSDRKSEKKKKKEKHKHKDKEKSKEKHKHKHKDKDKERHREKKDKERNEDTPTAAPIKITIPKDKLNLSTESSPTVIGAGMSDKNISPQSTVLKIKIPKERLKVADNVPVSSPVQPPVVQGPLKIKIRTDGISRSSTAPAPSSMLSSSLTSSANGSSGTAHYVPSSSESLFANETGSRKRVEAIGDSSGGPLAKKQTLMMPATGYGQGHRPGERQNGRHYNTGSSNKVRGRGGRQHHGGRGPPPHHATAAGQRGSAGGGHYQRDGYGNGRGGRNHHQAPYHPHQPHHPPAVRGDVGGYVRGPGRVEQTAEPYFYANYPPSMFNTPAGYMYDSAYQQYYQQQFQQQSQGYSMYPAGNGLMITPDGAVNTSMPPPPPSSSSSSVAAAAAAALLPNHPYSNRNMMPHQSATSVRREDLQSLPQPPLAPPPSPPPLPNGPPPPPPPPPPSMPE